MASLLSSKLKKSAASFDDEDYLDCVSDLISHDIVWSMDDFEQHIGTSCLDHSFTVSYMSYRLCRRLGLDFTSAARGGLLHDFFLYDWHLINSHGKHGFTHPGLALRNANKHFNLNKIEEEIIKKHMWPLTIIPPRCRESWVVMLVDKYCTCSEMIRFRSRQIFDLVTK